MTTILKRLHQSFDELDRAISAARESKDLPEAVSKRIQQYDAIIAKQRGICVRLAKAIKKGDWDQVNRHVGIINGLSAMIRDDAKDILGKYITIEQNDSMC
jgi:hypothetical protein